MVYANQAGTVERIRESSVKLFSKRWYSSVSVAEICRDAGVSNGIFYRYFDNKEALIKALLEEVIARIASALAGMTGQSVHERLGSMVEILVRFSAEHPDLVTVFREGQYRYFEYERRLVELYKKYLAQALGRGVGMPEYLFAMGGVRFVGVRAALHGTEARISAIRAVLQRGAFPGLGFDEAKLFGITISPPPIRPEEGTRERLLRAGKRLFGEKGFHEVNIHEITGAAGLAVGSFYKYFESKESFFGELISMAGREIRRFITANLSPGLNRLERELQGIYLFGVFLSLDRWCYNIVREGEFIAPERVRAYYAAFDKGYAKLGAEGMDPDEAAKPGFRETLVEFLLGISHYYGIELLFEGYGRGSRPVIAALGKLLAEGIER